MTVRLIACTSCGHMIRFGASHCGQCMAPSPALNRTSVHLAALGTVVAVCVVAAVFLLG